MRFSVRSLSDEYCFEDVVCGLREALSLAGHEVITGFDNSPQQLIVFGIGAQLPPGAIVFNTEQFAAEQNPHLLNLLPRLHEHIVWDYSQANVDWLKKNGVDRAVFCPIGYVPSMETLVSVHSDVDVLWYGSPNERRMELVRDLERAGGMSIKCLYGYGKQRDSWIARSKVVLNTHFYDRAIFEIFRCSHLLANRKCVVTEVGNVDMALEDFAARACIAVRREEIVETCRSLVRRDNVRMAQEMFGYEEFKKVSFVDSVRGALAASGIV